MERQAAASARDSRDQRKGFFTDTTLCIGCKPCEVACKQWNQLPEDGFLFTEMSYDNTVALGVSTWRHVRTASSAFDPGCRRILVALLVRRF